MSVTFLGGEVDDKARDEIHWMELHGFRIDYAQNGRKTEYYFTIPQRCNALQEVEAAYGVTNYVCGVYETRPQMCRDYDGRMSGPFGVADCLWKLEQAQPDAGKRRRGEERRGPEPDQPLVTLTRSAS
jgi:hypothetical protein